MRSTRPRTRARRSSRRRRPSRASATPASRVTASATAAGRKRESAWGTARRGLAADSRTSSCSAAAKSRPGRRFAPSIGSRPSSRARSQARDASSTTGPLAPKCVHSSAPLRRSITRPPARTTSSTSCATPESGTWKVPARTRGTRAGVVGTIVWPSVSAIRRPWPSLPVFGSESPPVASTTPDTATVSRVVRTTQPASSASTASTRSPARSTTPRRRASSRSACRTTRERFASGNSLPSTSSCSGTSISRKKATVSATPKPRRTRRTRCGGPPLKSDSATVAFVTLQRDPPLTRIFAPGWRAPSKRTMGPTTPRRAAKMAVASPAAPAPTMAITDRAYVIPRTPVRLVTGQSSPPG